MSSSSSTSRGGRLRIGENTTVSVHPPRAREVRLQRDPVLGVLSLEERFVDEGEIGRGGMGSVHRVLERTLNRPVAMKVLPPERASEHQLRSRFLAEAQVAGQLEHPNIVPVYELGADDDGRLFFTMRLIEGQTFSEYLRDLPPDDEALEGALEIFFRVCDALSFAHSRGVIHRDVKPANIMVAEHGQVYLMDWGIARVLTGSAAGTQLGDTAAGAGRHRPATLSLPAVDDRGLVLGTYSYMSPEQACGAVDDMDQRTDVFMLGAVLYRIAAGKPPIEADSAVEALTKAMAAAVPDVRDQVSGMLRRSLIEVSLQAMQKEPAQRFQGAAALKAATQAVLRGRFRFPVRSVPAGAGVLREGERGDDAYYIRSGQVQVFSERDGVKVSLRTLGPGEVFGETAVFTGQPRNASVAALTDAELIVVPGRFLAGALGLDSWLGAFVRTLGERFTEGSRRLTEVERGRLRFEVATEAYRLLAFGGRARPDGARSAPFSELRRQLAGRLELDDDELERLLQEVGLRLEGPRAERILVAFG